MYLRGLIADDVFFFLIVSNKVHEGKKSLMCYQGVEIVEYLCFRNSVIRNVTNVVLILHFCFCESLS